MEKSRDDRPSRRPLLLKFSRLAVHATSQIRYDAARKVNLLGGGFVPAVLAGIDVKTIPPGPHED